MKVNLSSDYSDLRLICENGSELYLIILDAETGALKQKESLSESVEGYIDIFFKNGEMAENDSEEFIGVSLPSDRIIVMSRNAPGKYVKSIDASMTMGNEEEHNLFVGGFLRAAFVFKDGKLGACTNYLSISEDGGNENFIGIYDKDGLRYLGKIRSSLLSSCFVYDISADGYDVKLSLR